ncbi:MAG: hypothetical protein MJZ97_02550 [Bacteroidales bacterium]|nr:hypothetical protein [Bacteroidales bacterium]
MEKDISSLIESLKNLKNLHESGVLTKEEMEATKTKLLKELELESEKMPSYGHKKMNFQLPTIVIITCVVQILFDIWCFYGRPVLWR